MAEIPPWHIAGDWFDVCNCDIPCPCEFAQPPTGNVCYGVLAYHIREGHYGDVPLTGLNLVLLGTFEGNIWTGQATNLKLGLFLDDRANARQQEALQMIFSGQAGGTPAWLSAIRGTPTREMLGMEVVPIAFEVANDLAFWRAEVPGKVVARAEALTGPTTPPGQRVQTLNPPGSEVGPGQVATWGKATTHRVEALGLKWEADGKSSKHIPFDWSGPPSP
jgi:hypothetical protein